MAARLTLLVLLVNAAVNVIESQLVKSNLECDHWAQGNYMLNHIINALDFLIKTLQMRINASKILISCGHIAKVHV